MNTLYAYIREGEHQQQDFKFRVDDAKRIARTLAAFANTDGGRLLIGVKDNGKVVGVNPDEEFYVIEGAASLYCKPEVKFKSQVLNDKHKLVLEVVVDKAENELIYAKDDEDKWKVYIRRDDHTLLANKLYVALWNRRGKQEEAPQTFDDNELELLRIIREEQPLTLSKIYRKSGLKKGYIDKLLVLLISWGVVSMDFTEKGTFYSIRDNEKLNQI